MCLLTVNAALHCRRSKMRLTVEEPQIGMCQNRGTNGAVPFREKENR